MGKANPQLAAVSSPHCRKQAALARVSPISAPASGSLNSSFSAEFPKGSSQYYLRQRTLRN